MHKRVRAKQQEMKEATKAENQTARAEARVHRSKRQAERDRRFEEKKAAAGKKD